MKQQFKVGDWVKSDYQNQWKGVIEEVFWIAPAPWIKKDKGSWGYAVRQIIAARGNQEIVNKKLSRLNGGWLESYSPTVEELAIYNRYKG